jgi:hypothetical protein
MSNLTAKQKLWADHYVVCLNATEAARLAGYSGDDNALAARGSENVRNRKVSDYINKLMSEKTIQKDEVLARLSEHATADMSDFTRINEKTGYVEVDLLKAQARGKLHLIKKLNFNKNGILESIELQDQQAALVHIGRSYSLFKDVQKREDWRDTALEYIRQGKVTYPAIVAEYGKDLAVQLFKQAGVPVEGE